MLLVLCSPLPTTSSSLLPSSPSPSSASAPNAHAYTYNRWEMRSWFRWEIWVGDLLSPRSNCLPLLQNLRLQVSTPWLWGIVRFRYGGRAKDMIQTMILTDVMISAAHPPLPAICQMTHTTNPALLATRCLPHASRFPGLGICNSTSLWIEYVVAYSGGVEFSTGRFWPMENSEFVEALGNRRLYVCGSFR